MEKVIRNECIIIDCFDITPPLLPHKFKDRLGPEFDLWYKRERPDFRREGWGCTGCPPIGYTCYLYLNSEGKVIREEYINPPLYLHKV